MNANEGPGSGTGAGPAMGPGREDAGGRGDRSEKPVERLVALAHALLREHRDEPERAKDHVAGVRARVEAIARAGEAASKPRAAAVVADLRSALAAAGLGALAPAGASIVAIEAGLRRLHGIVSALAVTSAGKRPPSPPPARRGTPPSTTR